MIHSGEDEQVNQSTLDTRRALAAEHVAKANEERANRLQGEVTTLRAEADGLRAETERLQQRCRDLEQAATDLGNCCAEWHNEYQKTKPAQIAAKTVQTIQRVRSLFEKNS